MNGIVFPHYFSICSLLVYRKDIDFCKLILYLATLLKLFMISRNFLVEFFGSFRYKIMSSANRDSLISSLPNCVPFISSFSLIDLSRDSKTMLNRSGERWAPLSYS
jgi:hypothetical protein